MGWSKTEIALRDDIIRSRDHDIQQLQIALRKDRAENQRLRHPFRNVDAIDWRHLMSWIPDSGHGKFWKEVFSEIRLAHEQALHPEEKR